jgi:hypothetical protein
MVLVIGYWLLVIALMGNWGLVQHWCTIGGVVTEVICNANRYS